MRARAGFGPSFLATLVGCALFAGQPGPTPLQVDATSTRQSVRAGDAASKLDAGAWTPRAASAWNINQSDLRWHRVGSKPSPDVEPSDVASLRQTVEQPDPVTARNAAILLAQQGDPRGRDKLIVLIRDASTTTPVSARAAAAEALSRLSSPETPAQLRALYRALGQGDAWVRAELLRGLARHVAPDTEPLLRDALGDSQAAVRRAAVEAWLDPRTGPLPDRVLRAGHDPDSGVRSAVIDAIGIHRAVEAESIVEIALKDRDRGVRSSAAAALARLNTERARTLLEERAEQGEDLDRADAVRALGLCGETKFVYRAADDPSWHVRQAAAEAMAAYPNAKTATALESLVADRSLQVQTTAVEAVADWPDSVAVPVLLQFIADGTFRARSEAYTQLEARWGRPLDAPETSAPQPWKAFAARLHEEWKRTHGLIEPARLRGNPLTAPVVETTADRQVADLLDQLEGDDPATVRQSVDKLIASGPSALPAIHRWAEHRPPPLPKALTEEVLPALSPLYAAVHRLGDEETAERQQAAADLAKLVERQTLPPAAAEQIARRLALENDPFVWQRSLSALEQDHVALARQTARVGLGHAHPLVRRQSCELLARRPTPEQVGWLEPMLRDEYPAVRLAAAEALGASGNPTAAPALWRALATPSKPLRITAGAALVQVGDPRGCDELNRLAYDADADVRRETAAAMGRVGEPRFLPALIALLDDQQLDVRRAALTSLESIAGDRLGPDQAVGGATQQERIEAWKRWWRERGVGSVSPQR